MKPKMIVDGLYMLPGLVNEYLLRTADGYALLDSGFPGSADKILAALASIGIQPSDVHHIVLTHGHPDHIGSAAALQRATGARVYAHALEGPIITAGEGYRKSGAAPGLFNKIMTQILLRTLKKVEGTGVDQFIADGESMPFDADLVAVHIPGHCAGQLAFLWKRDGGVLFTADACINRRGMKLTAAVENLEDTRRSLAKLSGLTFNIACFGHGNPIVGGADAAFRSIWLKTAAT